MTNDELVKAVFAAAMQGALEYEKRRTQMKRDLRRMEREERKKEMKEKANKNHVSLTGILKLILIVLGVVVLVCGIIVTITRYLRKREEDAYAYLNDEDEDYAEDPDIAGEFDMDM